MYYYFTQFRLTNLELLWKGVIFLAISYMAIETTFFFAHDFHTISLYEVISEVIISILFTIDLAYGLKKRKKKSSPKLTFFTEDSPQKFNLIIDILAIIPIDLIIYALGIPVAHSLGHLFRLVKLVKVAKIYNLVPIFSGLHFRVRITLIMLWSLIAIHWIACGWIMVHPIKGDIFTIYNKAAYWAVTTLTTIGYGDITPNTNLSRLYTMVIMILGVGVYGVVIGNVTKMIYQNDRHKERAREKLNDLTMIMKHYNIPLKVQRDVFSYYNLLFTKRLTENDSQIVSELPSALKDELQIYMNIKLIQSVSLFKACTTECLKEIAANLEQLSYSPGQKVITKGEIGQEMYIVYHGNVETRGENGQILNSYADGQAFGQIALLQETTRTFDVRASTYTDLFKLNKDVFLSVIEKNPNLLKTLEKSLKKRSADRS
jgi:voltage-gated potassium channel